MTLGPSHPSLDLDFPLWNTEVWDLHAPLPYKQNGVCVENGGPVEAGHALLEFTFGAGALGPVCRSCWTDSLAHLRGDAGAGGWAGGRLKQGGSMPSFLPPHGARGPALPHLSSVAVGEYDSPR